MTKIKKPCLAPYHPFKQIWYWHDPEYSGSSPNYCSSCSHFHKMLLMMIHGLLLRPYETLYGNKTIQLTREDAHALLDEAFDQVEKTS